MLGKQVRAFSQRKRGRGLQGCHACPHLNTWEAGVALQLRPLQIGELGWGTTPELLLTWTLPSHG